MIKEGQMVTVSVQSLYGIGIPLKCGRIDVVNNNGQYYYDIYNEDDKLACCDGEECFVEQVGSELITLVNDHGSSSVRFTLTKEEAAMALFM